MHKYHRSGSPATNGICYRPTGSRGKGAIRNWKGNFKFAMTDTEARNLSLNPAQEQECLTVLRRLERCNLEGFNGAGIFLERAVEGRIRSPGHGQLLDRGDMGCT